MDGKMTKTRNIERHLKEKGELTSWDAFSLYGATRLSSIIFNLRKKYDIETEMVDTKDRNGNPSHFAVYKYRGELDG